MRDSEVFVGVDIGSSKIAVIIAKAEEETVNVLGVSEIPSRGIRKGQIVDIEEAASSINVALDSAERMAGYSVNHVFVSISGTHVQSQNSKGIVAISEPHGEIIENDVERVLEAAGALSLPSTTKIIHVLPKSFTVDGESGIKDPVGMTGVRLEVDTHIITANSTSVKNIERVLEQEAGVNLQGLVFSGLASAMAVLTDTEKELGVIVADIGAGITNICMYVDGALAYSGVIPIGARHITNDLAIGLRISLESAEKIKIYLSQKYGKKQRTVGLSDMEEEGDDVDLSSLGLTEDLKKLSKKTLVDGIMRPRLNELFTMIGMELKKSGLATQTPAGIVITGGGARTVGAEEAAKRMLSMPVRTGIPSGISGLIDDVENPSFATAIGLLMYGRGFRPTVEGGFMEGMFSSLPIKNIFGMKGRINFKKILKNLMP